MRPMFATPGPLPEGEQWRYEVQWAGLRVLAEITEGTLRLTTPDERDVTARFPELGGLADRLQDGVLDGEIIVLADGIPTAPTLPTSPAAAGRPGGKARPGGRVGDRSTELMVFDVLRLYGVPLLYRPLDERRATLERVRVDDAPHVTLSPVYDDGVALLAAVGLHRLPGVVAKRADSPYRPGVRDPSWVTTAPPTPAG
jgi:bifunctional non-homologous end joining protein LigD